MPVFFVIDSAIFHRDRFTRRSFQTVAVPSSQHKHPLKPVLKASEADIGYDLSEKQPEKAQNEVLSSGIAKLAKMPFPVRKREMFGNRRVRAVGKFCEGKLHCISRKGFLPRECAPFEENTTMIATMDPKEMDKPSVRCAECDREVVHYNKFVSSTNEERHICWQCLAREEKGFNARRDFSRSGRRGVVPR